MLPAPDGLKTQTAWPLCSTFAAPARVRYDKVWLMQMCPHVDAQEAIQLLLMNAAAAIMLSVTFSRISCWKAAFVEGSTSGIAGGGLMRLMTGKSASPQERLKLGTV